MDACCAVIPKYRVANNRRDGIVVALLLRALKQKFIGGAVANVGQLKISVSIGCFACNEASAFAGDVRVDKDKFVSVVKPWAGNDVSDRRIRRA